MNLAPIAIVSLTAFLALWSAFIAGGAFALAESPEYAHKRKSIRIGAIFRLASAVVTIGVSLWLASRLTF
jgi:hypothetical protein